MGRSKVGVPDMDLAEKMRTESPASSEWLLASCTLMVPLMRRTPTLAIMAHPLPLELFLAEAHRRATSWYTEPLLSDVLSAKVEHPCGGVGLGTSL